MNSMRTRDFMVAVWECRTAWKLYYMNSNAATAAATHWCSNHQHVVSCHDSIYTYMCIYYMKLNETIIPLSGARVCLCFYTYIHFIHKCIACRCEWCMIRITRGHLTIIDEQGESMKHRALPGARTVSLNMQYPTGKLYLKATYITPSFRNIYYYYYYGVFYFWKKIN